MSKNLKIFFISLILALPLFWGINIFEKDLEKVFFWQRVNPQTLTAQASLEKKLESLKPIKKRGIKNLEIEAKSAISVYLPNEPNRKEKILFEKEIRKKLPIASLTKLMTAKVVLENYDLSRKIKVSQKAIKQPENLGKLKIGAIYPVKYLLYPLLIESSNDAAFSLASDYNGMTEEKFVKLMNLEVKKIGLKNSFFVNPTGLDPDPLETEINYSTAEDLVKLTKSLLKEPLIWEILSLKKYNLYGPELVNTNKLLGKIPGIIGGKTGYTEKALGCMVLVLKAPKEKGYLINVILGSENKFSEMEKLVNWVKKSYRW